MVIMICYEPKDLEQLIPKSFIKKAKKLKKEKKCDKKSFDYILKCNGEETDIFNDVTEITFQNGKVVMIEE